MANLLFLPQNLNLQIFSQMIARKATHEPTLNPSQLMNGKYSGGKATVWYILERETIFGVKFLGGWVVGSKQFFMHGLLQEQGSR